MPFRLDRFESRLAPLKRLGVRLSTITGMVSPLSMGMARPSSSSSFWMLLLPSILVGLSSVGVFASEILLLLRELLSFLMMLFLTEDFLYFSISKISDTGTPARMGGSLFS